MSDNSNKNSEDTKKDYLKKTLYSISLIVVVSMFSKVLNLGCNIFLARLINKETYGIAKVYLEFAMALILYFPRETIRKSGQKFCPDNYNEDKEKANFFEVCQLNWILVIIFAVFSLPLYTCFVNFGGEGLAEVKLHLLIYILMGNLEIIIEPIIVYLNIKIENHHKIACTTTANYLRILSNLFLAYLFGFQLWSFTISRIISTTFYVSYMLYVGLYKLKIPINILLPDFKKIKSILFDIIFKSKNEKSNDHKYEYYTLSPYLKETFYSFVKTTILKMVLTHTEKFSLSFFLTLSEADKGEYSFISDNFSIIMRYILEPIEENFYNFINRVKESKSYATKDDVKLIQDQKTINNRVYLLKILKISIRFMLLFGVLLMGYVFIIGREVITFVYTDKWSTNSSIAILKSFSVYVAIISINGIVEAFANATYTARMMNKYNMFMIYNSIMLIVFCIVFSQFNIIGLIIANGLTMLFRISVHFYLIFSIDDKRPLPTILSFMKSSFFKVRSLMIIIVCLICVYQVRSLITRLFTKVMVSGLIFLINCGSIFLIERYEFREIFKSNAN